MAGTPRRGPGRPERRNGYDMRGLYAFCAAWWALWAFIAVAWAVA